MILKKPNRPTVDILQSSVARDFMTSPRHAPVSLRLIVTSPMQRKLCLVAHSPTCILRSFRVAQVDQAPMSVQLVGDRLRRRTVAL